MEKSSQEQETLEDMRGELKEIALIVKPLKNGRRFLIHQKTLADEAGITSETIDAMEFNALWTLYDLLKERVGGQDIRELRELVKIFKPTV